MRTNDYLFYATLVIGLGDELMRKKRGVWAIAGCAAVIACVFLGVFYHFLCGPMCWQCWSDKESLAISGRPPKVNGWLCAKCKANWPVGSPWARGSDFTNAAGEIPWISHRKVTATMGGGLPATTSGDTTKTVKP